MTKSLLIVAILAFILGLTIGGQIAQYRNPKIVTNTFENKDSINTLNKLLQANRDSINHLNHQKDSLTHLKQKVVLKEKLIIKTRNEENSIILSTPDSNIIKLFSKLSTRLDSKTRTK